MSSEKDRKRWWGCCFAGLADLHKTNMSHVNTSFTRAGTNSDFIFITFTGLKVMANIDDRCVCGCFEWVLALTEQVY